MINVVKDSSKILKIDNFPFTILDLLIQYRIDPPYSCDIFIIFDIIKYPQYEKNIMNLYDSRKKFDVYSNRFQIIGNHIKMIDISDGHIEITLSCDYFQEVDLLKKRSEIIDDILRD